MNDELWGGESLVSDNCRFLLILLPNGQLTLVKYTGNKYGLKGRSLLQYEENNDEWSIGWQSNNTIKNYSGKAEVQLILSQGGFQIIEWQYRGSYSIPPEIIWESNIDGLEDNMNINANEYDGDTLTLTLSEFGQLILTQGDSYRHPRYSIWYTVYNDEEDEDEIMM